MGNVHADRSLGLFDRIRVGLPPAVPRGDLESLVVTPRQPARPIVRLGRYDCEVPKDAPLTLDLRAFSFVSVTGSERTRYSVEVQVGVTREPSKDQIVLLTNAAAIDKERGTLTVSDPPGSKFGDYQFYVDIEGPFSGPLVVRAPWAAVDVADVSAPIAVDSAHGRISLLKCSGDNKVIGGIGTHIVWAGCPGSVDLAGDSIDSLVSDTMHPGCLRSRARGNNRLFVPRYSICGLEVRVPRDDLFKCDPELRRQITRVGDAPLWRRMAATTASTISLSSEFGCVEVCEYE